MFFFLPLEGKMAHTKAWYTPMEEIPKAVKEARDEFASFKTFPASFRKHQLRQLGKLIDENKKRIHQALSKDLHKHYFEVDQVEILLLNNEIVNFLEKLEEWMAPEKPSVPLINMGDNCQIVKDPLGTVLIISPWNYPFQLLMVPLVGAIAAGCCAILKPSEISENTAQLITELIPKYLDSKCYKVINGGVAETSLLLDQRWDHIMYTGAGNVGKIVMAAAARQLCPVTLELGGKSPCFVDKNCDFKVIANRIVWGRFLNAGQTCIAPDYILALPGVQDILVKHIRESIKNFYGENPQKSEHYCRIINKNHFNRLLKMIGDSKIAIGGEHDESDLYIAPTVLVDVSPDAPIMKDEIFGPVLPIITIENADEAIAFINSRDKPLALYVFSNDSSLIQKFLQRTSSGGFLANDTLMHISVSTLPLGGVGPSGMSSYHGKRSFEIFTHHKSTMLKNQGLEAVNALRYPPYNDTNYGWLKLLLWKKESSGSIIPKQVIYAAIIAAIIGRIYVAVPGFLDGLKAFFGLA